MTLPKRLSHYIGLVAAGKVGDSDCVELSRYRNIATGSEVIKLRLAGEIDVTVVKTDGQSVLIQ